MIQFGDINYLAVMIATIVTMLLGFLWYSPVLFGNAWVKLIGLKKEEMSGGPLTYVLTALTALGGCYLLALLLTLPNERTIAAGVTIGLIIGLSISVKIGMNYLFEKKSLPLFFVTIGYHLVTYLLAGIIIGAM